MDLNPYQPPNAKLTDDSMSMDIELADRSQRFGAVLLDGLIGLIVAIPITFGLGIFDYVRRGQQAPWSLTVASAALGFLGFIVLQSYYLKKHGQTIGKKIVGIRIVTQDNHIPGIAKLLLLRYLHIRIAAVIPFVGGLYALIDALFIFRQDRRCLHDLIAATKVVKVR